LAHLRQQVLIEPQARPSMHYLGSANNTSKAQRHYPDMADVKGQLQARRCLEIAAAGEHNLLFSGPPGTGKTMLASRLPGILPPLTEQECLEVAAIYSLFPASSHQLAFGQRPFRSPHHSASSVALVGGGSHPKPGEISLAHRGVLFLDELPEYQRQVLEVLREPLESGGIEISRANQQVHFPARFQLIAAMNPCPCGYFGDPEQHCRCSPDRVRRYQDKISGPLLDRIDLKVTLARIPHGELFGKAPLAESSAAIRQRVEAARQLQWQRQGCSNSQLDAKAVEQHCALQPALANWLATAAERLKLSPRAYFRLIKVARSIADLSQSQHIEAAHLHEAISYRGQH
jgi:magnesium chelatase family protein